MKRNSLLYYEIRDFKFETFLVSVFKLMQLILLIFSVALDC